MAGVSLNITDKPDRMCLLTLPSRKVDYKGQTLFKHD
jgi:hypothetical protein